MPMAAEIPVTNSRRSAVDRIRTRQKFSIPEESVVFCFGFDVRSVVARKNPIGALDAFQKAFPYTSRADDNQLPNVSLLIKSFPFRGFSPEWELVKARCMEDPRIILVCESLTRSELLDLYQSCDIFLSMHRSEGFGRGIAEALQLGLKAICTDFGGNVDYCRHALSNYYPVNFSEMTISPGQYPFSTGHLWAEPDIDHAAKLCREVSEVVINEERNLEKIEVLSHHFVGSAYKNSLEKIYR